MSKRQTSRAPYCRQGQVDPVVLQQLRMQISLPTLRALDGVTVSVAHIWTRRASTFSPLNDVSLSALVATLYGSHVEQDEKDGHALIFAELEQYRIGSCAKKVHILGFDFDATTTREILATKLGQHGVASLLHTSYGHGQTRTKLENLRAVTDSRIVPSIGPLADEEARYYCNQTPKLIHLANVVVMNGGKPVTTNGAPHYLVEHDEVGKFRVLVFLREPIDLAEVGADGFKALYAATADLLFGSGLHDAACSNVSRIFYTPSKPPGSKVDHCIQHFDGDLFGWRDVWSNISADVKRRRDEALSRRRALASEDQSSQLFDIAFVLQHISPDVSRSKWVSALSAVHNETNGSDDGRRLAHEWSAGSLAKYNEDHLDSVWDYFTDSDYSGRKATMGTLVMLAREEHPDFWPSARPPFDQSMYDFS